MLERCHRSGRARFAQGPRKVRARTLGKEGETAYSSVPRKVRARFAQGPAQGPISAVAGSKDKNKPSCDQKLVNFVTGNQCSRFSCAWTVSHNRLVRL